MSSDISCGSGFLRTLLGDYCVYKVGLVKATKKEGLSRAFTKVKASLVEEKETFSSKAKICHLVWKVGALVFQGLKV